MEERPTEAASVGRRSAVHACDARPLGWSARHCSRVCCRLSRTSRLLRDDAKLGRSRNWQPRSVAHQWIGERAAQVTEPPIPQAPALALGDKEKEIPAAGATENAIANTY